MSVKQWLMLLGLAIVVLFCVSILNVFFTSVGLVWLSTLLSIISVLFVLVCLGGIEWKYMKWSYWWDEHKED